MALKIKFADGNEVEYISAVEMEEYYNGSSRRTLTFGIAPGTVNIQELSDLCTEDNCKVLELTNDDVVLQDKQGAVVPGSVTNIYEGYALRLNIGIKQEYDAIEEKSYEIVELKLGKRTRIEQALHDMGIN